MNKHKRLLSFALALVLIVGMLPMNALATDTPTHIASCVPDCALVDCDCPCHKLCPECDATMDAEGKTVHGENCPTLLCTCEPVEGIHISPCVLAPVVQDLAPLCEKCTASYAADGVTIVHKPGCENQQPLCEECTATLGEDGKLIHDEKCPTRCSCTPKATGETPHTNPECPLVEQCEHCHVPLTPGATHLSDCITNCKCDPKPTGEADHTNDQCPFYMAKCEYCKVVLTEDAVHPATCLTHCKCEPKPTGEADHTNDQCPFYVAKCEYCKVVLTDDAVHPETCLTHCKCEPKPTGEADHTNTQCPFYVAKCEYCKVVLTEDAVHPETCLTHCKCEPKPTGEAAHTNEQCPFYVAPPVYDQLSSAATLADFRRIMMAEENREAVQALTAEEITDLTAKVEALYGAIVEPSKEETGLRDELVETLSLLPAMECPECHQFGTHTDECTKNTNKLDNFNVSTNESDSYTPSNGVTVNLFDYGSLINSRDVLPFGMGGASGNNYFDFQFYDAGSKVQAGKIANYPGIGGDLGTYPVLVNGSPAVPSEDTTNAYIATSTSAAYLFSRDIPLGTALPKDLTTEVNAATESYNNKTFTRKLPTTRQVPMYEALRYPVTNQMFTSTSDGYYSFDSRHTHAWYDFEDQALVLEDYAVRPAQVDSRYWAMGHFLPFNGPISNYADGQDALKITNKATPTLNKGDYTPSSMASRNYTNKDLYAIRYEQTEDGALCQHETRPEGLLGQVKKNGENVTNWTGTINNDNRANMWIGMSVEFNFNQTLGGKKNGNDVIYEFSGDDYMWVYIDDVLILDIAMSGIHDRGQGGAKTATINFSTGDVVVYKVDGTIDDVPDSNGDGIKNAVDYQAACATGASNAVAYVTNLRTLFEKAKEAGYIETIPAFKEGTNTFADYSTHSFKMFYMDTGHGTSNCMIKFNLDPIPTKNVTLEKAVAGINPALQDDQEYEFKLTAKDTVNDNGGDLGVSNIDYTINDAANTTGKIKHNDTIKLKAGQKLTLKDVPVTTAISFTEIENEFTTEAGWTCNGENYTEGEQIVISNPNGDVNFVCTNTRKVGDLSITKAFAGVLHEPEKEFTMVVTIAGNPYTGTGSNNKHFASDGSITLKNGETVTIEGIPSGMAYTVVENNPNAANGYAYAFDDETYPKYTNGTGKITVDTTAVTVTNAHVYADLVIDKNITGGEQADENQTFLFTVSGGPAKVNTKVLVKGDGQAKVAHLPVGNGTDASYTITEDTAWSWRYELSGVKAKDAANRNAKMEGNGITIKLPATGETVTFTNKRVNPYWITGDCHAENAWTDSGIDATINGVQRPEEGDDTNA